MEDRDKRIMDLSMEAGIILLECGAEIFRVEETIERIARSYGIQEVSDFVVGSGIYLTGENQKGEMYAKVRATPVGGTQLNKVDAVNRLSREIEAGMSLEEAEERLRFIRGIPGKRDRTLILASGMGAGCFAYILGGNLPDSVSALIAGLILGGFLALMRKRKRETSKLALNLLAAFLATASSYFLCQVGIGTDYRAVTVGAIMPMLPGVSFVNAVRDLADSDYISGAIRMLDVLMVTAGIAIGVGIFYILCGQLAGGFRLE